MHDHPYPLPAAGTLKKSPAAPAKKITRERKENPPATATPKRIAKTAVLSSNANCGSRKSNFNFIAILNLPFDNFIGKLVYDRLLDQTPNRASAEVRIESMFNNIPPGSWVNRNLHTP